MGVQRFDEHYIQLLRGFVQTALNDGTAPSPLLLDKALDEIEALRATIADMREVHEERALATMQEQLPWGAHGYGAMFEALPEPFKHFMHAYVHLNKAMAKLTKVVDAMAHGDPQVVASTLETVTLAEEGVADLLWSLLRFCNQYPTVRLLLGSAYAARVRSVMGG